MYPSIGQVLVSTQDVCADQLYQSMNDLTLWEGIHIHIHSSQRFPRVIRPFLSIDILHRSGLDVYNGLAAGPLTLGHHNPTVCSFACRWRLRLPLVNKSLFSIETHPLYLIVGPYTDSSKVSYTTDTIVPSAITAE